ncbi:MAG: S-methyl-5'-thioinosine phosphorylase [Anaerolineae bacterium]|nr:S-methyl-5'-thioinosine phosphorylase [Anaerolineae bacterium]
MRYAIIAGTGAEEIEGTFVPEPVLTPYGPAYLLVGSGEAADLVFLPRHGQGHSIAPHKINYRANLWALQMLGVTRIMATFAVGSLKATVPPGGMVALDQFIDFTSGREGTFYDGGALGLAHTDMTEPYCTSLRSRLSVIAQAHGLEVIPRGTYACFNGPRFETAAEIRMHAMLGGDVVGQTGVPEAALARELGIHYAAVAVSINWAAGLDASEHGLAVDLSDMEAKRATLLKVFIETLRADLTITCNCGHAILFHFNKPEEQG